MNSLLHVGLVALLILFYSDSTFAQGGGGASGGNGGGLVVCRNKKKKIIKPPILIDYWEADEVHTRPVELPTGKDYMEIAGKMVEKFRSVSPWRFQLYKGWLHSFESERRILYKTKFRLLPDSYHVGVPIGCDYEQGANQIVPEFSDDFRYYINGELWDRMDEQQRAGLIFHELLYREAITYGHTYSRYVRFLHRSLLMKNQDERTDDRNATGTFSSFWATLIEARFEETDIAAEAPVTSVYWDRSVVMGPDFEKDIVKTGAILVRIGKCQDPSCSKFKQTITKNQMSSAAYEQSPGHWTFGPSMRKFIVENYDGTKTVASLNINPEIETSVSFDPNRKGYQGTRTFEFKSLSKLDCSIDESRATLLESTENSLKFRDSAH